MSETPAEVPEVPAHPYASRTRPLPEDRRIMPLTPEQFRHYRRVMGLTMDQTAVLMGVDPATVYRWGNEGITNHAVLLVMYYFAQHGPITASDVERVDGWMYSEGADMERASGAA